MTKKVIIDVREPEEYQKGHVDGAINIPPNLIMSGSDALSAIDKDAEIVLYCISGSRSNVCKTILQSQGYKNVVNGINMHHIESKYQ